LKLGLPHQDIRNGAPSLFAVLDGHGGDSCAHHAREHLPAKLMEQMRSKRPLGDAMKRALLACDEDFLKFASGCQAGSTACVVLCTGEGSLLCANVGDSRAVMMRADGVALALSNDHKGSSPEEVARIVQAGGYVVGGRVFGQLAVARALGDADLKTEVSGALVADAEILQVDLQTGDEFVIIACDGLWDTVDNQTACEFAKVRLDSGEKPSAVADALAKEAISRGSTDNVSVIIARFVTESEALESQAQAQKNSRAEEVNRGSQLISEHEHNRFSIAGSGSKLETTNTSQATGVTSPIKNDADLMDFLMNDDNFA